MNSDFLSRCHFPSLEVILLINFSFASVPEQFKLVGFAVC